MFRSLVRRASMIAAVATLAGVAIVPAASASSFAGAVYAITNSTAGNSVIAWDRHADGSLDNPRTYPTGGLGTGAGLGSQGAVTVDADHELLLAVNAGSNDVTSFRITGRGLVLADRIASGGTMPISVAVFDNLVYVLNAGTPNNVTGFKVGDDGDLRALAGSTRPLSADSTGPAQVGFSADGRTVVVTEKATSRIDTYAVGSRGRLAGPVVHASAGPTPFGFAITRRNTLFVSEAGGGGGASSYVIGRRGDLESASSNVMTGQRAACWAVVTPSGKFGYVTNAGTGNISGFRIREDGTASLLDASGVTATTGGNPTDAAVSRDGRFLYARVAATAQVAIFRIGADGSLSPIDPLTGTPAGLAGLAGF
ncbi:MAG TPA: beta-propeller fold lactonase family protein [Candidatus Limnocylindrales bacterium]|nr:beta-propeller fold lactonase family protein [Candidatus Limnocylindrales bacterium]